MICASFRSCFIHHHFLKESKGKKKFSKSTFRVLFCCKLVSSTISSVSEKHEYSTLITDSIIWDFLVPAFGNWNAKMTHYKHLHVSEVCLFPHLFFKNFKKPVLYKIRKTFANMNPTSENPRWSHLTFLTIECLDRFHNKVSRKESMHL